MGVPPRITGRAGHWPYRMSRPRTPGAPTRAGGPPGWLDPSLIPPGIFQHAWRPDAELTIRAGKDAVLVEVKLVPGADRRVLAQCHARLVDPGNRKVIATAPFVSRGDSQVRG